jgi:hypothetical protein
MSLRTRSFCWWPSHRSLVLQTDEPPLPDDDVVEQLDAEQPRGRDSLAGSSAHPPDSPSGLPTGGNGNVGSGKVYRRVEHCHFKQPSWPGEVIGCSGS